jgi:hypothetical protein
MGCANVAKNRFLQSVSTLFLGLGYASPASPKWTLDMTGSRRSRMQQLSPRNDASQVYRCSLQLRDH